MIRASSSPPLSWTTCCRPPTICRPCASCIFRPPRRTSRVGSKASVRAARSPRRLSSPMRSPTRSASKSIPCREPQNAYSGCGRARSPRGKGRLMKPPPFEYHAPTTLDDALALLALLGDEAKVLAGGQSLVPLLNFRLARPAHLVDLNRIPDLAYIRAWDSGVAIGAMTRQRTAEREEVIARRAPLLRQAAPYI